MRRSVSPCYLDSSALVKLVDVEPESQALKRHLAAHPSRVSSALSTAEVIRAARRHGPKAVRRARVILDQLDLLAVNPEVLDAAGMLDPLALRTLDAIHLASALRLEAGELVTYDVRMARAAETVGLSAFSPR